MGEIVEFHSSIHYGDLRAFAEALFWVRPDTRAWLLPGLRGEAAEAASMAVGVRMLGGEDSAEGEIVDEEGLLNTIMATWFREERGSSKRRDVI